MSQAGLIDIENSHPQIPTRFDGDSGSAIPIANVLEVFGSTVASLTYAKPIFVTASGNTLLINTQVGKAIAGAPGDKLDAGIASYNTAHFNVDTDGYVELKGGPGPTALTIIGDQGSGNIQDVNGHITIVGSTVENATHAKPVYFNDTAVSSSTIDVQVATERTGSPGDKNDAGLASFNDKQFVTDVDGYTSIIGGNKPVVLTITGDDAEAVGPDGSGNVDWQGSTVANATNAKPLYFNGTPAANLMEPEIQVAADRTGAPGNVNDAGLASFNDKQFVTDVDGYTSVIGGDKPVVLTVTGDDADAVGPDGDGNIDWQGSTVANGTNAKPLYMNGTSGSNLMEPEIQLTVATSKPGDSNDAGICSFLADHFDVDANGNVDVELSQESATPDASDLAGICYFNNAQFDVNAFGWVSLITPNDNFYRHHGNNCFFSNLSFTHSAGTLTLASGDGTALSASNPGYVVMGSNATPGELVVHDIVANDTLTVANLTNNIFGTTASVAWGNDMPLYIGFMADATDANLEPVLCRVPNLDQSPAASTDIGDPSSAAADKEFSVFSWNDITEADYQDKSIGMIGSLRATKDGSDVWTLVAMDVLDGPGKWQHSRAFSFPVGHNGAASGKHMSDNGGTAPQFTDTAGYQYTIRKDGYVSARWSSEACTSAGVGAVDSEISFPYGGVNQYRVVGATRFLDNSGSLTYIGFNEWITGGPPYLLNIYIGTSSNTPLPLTSIDLNDKIIMSATCVLSQTHVT